MLHTFIQNSRYHRISPMPLTHWPEKGGGGCLLLPTSPHQALHSTFAAMQGRYLHPHPIRTRARLRWRQVLPKCLQQVQHYQHAATHTIQFFLQTRFTEREREKKKTEHKHTISKHKTILRREKGAEVKRQGRAVTSFTDSQKQRRGHNPSESLSP